MKKIVAGNTQIRFLPNEEKERAFNNASAVLTVSSTVGTEAAAVGTPVAFYKPANTPYVVGDPDFPSAKVCENPQELLLFLRSLKDRQAKEKMPEEKKPTAVENMVNAIRPMLRPRG